MPSPRQTSSRKAAGAWRGYEFTILILIAIALGMARPGWFTRWGTFDPQNKWLFTIVIQLVMFGMGTQMTLRDFRAVAKAPRGVGVGILCHFSVMPLVGYLLTKLFHFENEIAAGVILIGSCSSGLASNVMAYLARANLALSVAVTAATTLVAPVMTPLLMKLLAGRLVEVKFLDMMLQIFEIVVLPIGAALLHDYLKTAPVRARRGVRTAAAAACLWLAALGWAGWFYPNAILSGGQRGLLSVLNLVAGALVLGAAYHLATERWPRLSRAMPAVSMLGIAYFTIMTTAAGRDNLLKIGVWLFVASVLHNAAGYFFGYWLSRGSGLDRNSARSVAFEVGLQNGAMASGLAGAMGKLATTGLAAAIFSPWMNISGSLLANYWRRHPVDPAAEVPT